MDGRYLLFLMQADLCSVRRNLYKAPALGDIAQLAGEDMTTRLDYV
jgi:hypothetical protein